MKIRRAAIIVLSIIGVVVLAAAGFIRFLTITEFKPAPIETIDVITDRPTKELPKEFSMLSLNIGLFTESCGIDRNAIDKRGMKDF